MVKIEIVTIQEVKEALRIDYDDEDTYLNLCIKAAQSHLEDALDDFDNKILDDKFKNKAKIVVLMTIQNLFDNRVFSTDISSSTTNEKVKYILSSFMLQMRWT